MVVNKCLNIAMTVCYWCGKESGVAIGEKLVDCKNKWETNYVFGGYEPCDKCKEDMALGVSLLEVQTKPIFENQPEIQKGIYPTGRWVVMKTEAAKELFQNEDIKDVAFIDSELMDMIGVN